MVAQHIHGKLPREIFPFFPVRLLRGQSEGLFAVHFHVHHRVVETGNDAAAAHLKLEGTAAVTPVEHRAVFQGAGVMQLDEIAIFYLGHYFSFETRAAGCPPPASGLSFSRSSRLACPQQDL